MTYNNTIYQEHLDSAKNNNNESKNDTFCSASAY